MKCQCSLLMVCFLVFLLGIPVGQSHLSACTVATLVEEDSVLFAYNEDRNFSQMNQKTTLYFNHATENSLAFMEIRAEAPGILSMRIGINSFGLAVSGNGLEPYQLTPLPGKTYSTYTDSIMYLILRKARTIEDAERLIRDFDFGSLMQFQLHVADSEGNAFVLNPTEEGNTVFTWIEGAYLISTNTPRSMVDKLERDPRMKAALLAMHISGADQESRARTLLENTYQRNEESETVYSVILDPDAQTATLFLWNDFSNGVAIDIAEKFSQDSPPIPLLDLFPRGPEIDTAKIAGLRTRIIVTRVFRILSLLISLLIIIYGIFHVKHELRTRALTGSRRIGAVLLITGKGVILILFTLLSSAFIPALVLSNYWSNMVMLGIIQPEFIGYLILAAGSAAILVRAVLAAKRRKRIRKN